MLGTSSLSRCKSRLAAQHPVRLHTHSCRPFTSCQPGKPCQQPPGTPQSSNVCQSQVRNFNSDFHPDKTNIPKEYLFTRNEPDPTDINEPSQYTPKQHWKVNPADAFTVPNGYAQRARLTPVAVPAASGLPSISGYYQVELERNYKRDWPSYDFDAASGTVNFRVGFLEPLVDPELPPYFYYKGMELFEGSAVAQAAVAAVLSVGLLAVAAYLYSIQPLLLAAVAFSWARNKLSFGRAALLAALAVTDKVWLYWACVAVRSVDQVLEKHMPPVRNFLWGNFILWVLYMLLAPVYWFPVPFLAPASL